MYKSNERKIEVKLNIDENERYLSKLSDPRYQYSQLHKRQGMIRYYSAGVAIQSSDEFRRSLTREATIKMFSTPLVLCLSVDGKIEPNNEFVFKTYRRVYIPFGVEVQSIKVDGLMYNSFPQGTDFSLIKIEQCTIDLNLKQAKITGTIGVDFNLDETEYDKFHYFHNKIEPLYAHIQKVMIRPDLDIYGSELIANEAFKMATTMLKTLDLIHSHNHDANREVRERLINVLADSDKITLMPDNTIALSDQTDEDIIKKKKRPFAVGLYEYRGAYFKDRTEFESAMKFAEIMGQTEEDIIREKKIDNRYEYMMTFLTDEQRILEITEDEINDSRWVTYAMTKEEREEYESLRDDDNEKSKAARLELARAAKLRWKVVNGRI